ncbi:hypothetical protein ACIBJC_18195 [Streptomyces sp. NPDC050509]|uniref:hypothetical protein n=1 Tax=Streptomyces sp. NPDC050509 TaxID=3365620 RepID=UPI0037A11261
MPRTLDLESEAAFLSLSVRDQVSARGPAEFAARAPRIRKTVAKCPRAAWAIATGEDCRRSGPI